MQRLGFATGLPRIESPSRRWCRSAWRNPWPRSGQNGDDRRLPDRGACGSPRSMTEFRRTELAAELLAAADRLIKESDFWGAQARLGSYLSDVLWDALREPSDEAARRVLHSSGFVDRLRPFQPVTMSTSPFCTAGGCWLSSRMKRKTSCERRGFGPQ